MLQIIDVNVMTVMKVMRKVSIFFKRANNIGFGPKVLKIDHKGIKFDQNTSLFFKV